MIVYQTASLSIGQYDDLVNVGCAYLAKLFNSHADQLLLGGCALLIVDKVAPTGCPLGSVFTLTLPFGLPSAAPIAVWPVNDVPLKR